MNEKRKSNEESTFGIAEMNSLFKSLSKYPVFSMELFAKNYEKYR